MRKNLILIGFAAALFACNNPADKDDNTTDTTVAVATPMFQKLSTDTGWVSLFDGTLQGFELTDKPAFCFQGHPEASPGPQDVDYLFDRFIGLMEKNKA